ncbi:sensor histidine kinase [Leptolyngbya sp. AN02str]|uniref:sensor histidine kinase n=1 Tax=Leptolyngbya sp. AN02str TaxID=3423363 RepID=UPI003D312120
MFKWYLPTLSEIVAQDVLDTEATGSISQRRVRAEQSWSGAIAAVNVLLRAQFANQAPCAEASQCGLILSGPVPVLEQPEKLPGLSSWTFTSNPLWANTWMPFRLLPEHGKQTVLSQAAASTVPLVPNDPLGTEQFCLIITDKLSLVMVLGDDLDGNPAFLFSFDPAIIEQSWNALRARLLFMNSAMTHRLEDLVQRFFPRQPDYRIVTQFSRLMVSYLPEASDWAPEHISGSAQSVTRTSSPNNIEPVVPVHQLDSSGDERSLEALAQQSQSFDTELLQALVHEIRTPLTTIRTLTRLLLKRKDLSPDVLKRLSIIDQECTEQIDRFNLIFRAVELETAEIKQPISPLAPISLAQVFQQNEPRWQQIAQQRSLTLNLVLPHNLPMVVTDPTMLDQVLTGLIDRITQTLQPGSHMQLQVSLAGHQLKLQFQSQPQATSSRECGAKGFNHPVTPLKSLGQLLMFQPETGSLSLSLGVTKNLFQALGGKLIVKQRPEQGEVLTVYLPLDSRKGDD